MLSRKLRAVVFTQAYKSMYWFPPDDNSKENVMMIIPTAGGAPTVPQLGPELEEGAMIFGGLVGRGFGGRVDSLRQKLRSF